MTIRILTSATLAAFLLGAPLAVAEFPPVDQLPANDKLPDPLVMFDGSPVKTPDQWVQKRRPELKALFEHYMYGVAPPAPKTVRAKVERTDDEVFGGKATKKEITLSVGPEGAAPIRLLLITPNGRTPAPVFVGLNFCGNHTLLDDPTIPLPATWIYRSCPGVQDDRATDAGRGGQKDVWNPELIVDRGYALATFYNGDIDPDQPDFGDAIHRFYLKQGQSLGKHDWGTIAAWAWGLSRVVDYVATNPDLDAKRVIAVGHSRLGKTALLAAAFDERIAVAIPHQSGCGGAAPSRGTVGESVERINTAFPHWFCDTFPEFNKQVVRLPFDQNGLVALCAPRPVLFSNAEEDTWANPNGQFDVLKGADGVYRFLGVDGLGAEAPAPSGQLLDSRLGYYVRPGNHSMARQDWEVFLDFADKHLGKPAAK